MDSYDEQLARKEALSNWLAKTSRSVIREEIENIKAKVSMYRGQYSMYINNLAPRVLSLAQQFGI